MHRRLNRLLKCYRLFELFDLAQGRVRQVTVSLLKVVITCALIFHWNACAFYTISKFSDTASWDGVNVTFDDDEGWPWPYMPDKITDAIFADCSHFKPSPNETLQSVFEILDTIIGMVLFAGIMGSVGDLVAKANKVKADWQQRMDGLKQFMTYRLVVNKNLS
ncbi:hypothetical protein OSTOST_20753, partial [Ostertagia ostertagi]